MARELRLPELAESVVEGEIIRWLVAEGESVVLDQPVAEVLTDKATVELPSPYAGVLLKHLAAEGDVVAVNSAIALFSDAEAEAAPAPAAAAASATASHPPSLLAAEERSIVEPERRAQADDGESLSLFKPSAEAGGQALPQLTRTPAPSAVQAPPAARGAFGRVLAVPAARRLARELGVDVEHVIGSGPHGRVRVDDVRSHTAAPASAAGRFGLPPAPAYHTPAGYEDREERVPVRGLRRVIANQMVASHLHTVRTLHVDEADVTALVELREKLKPRAAARGVRLSYLPFVMKAVATALAEFPALNTSLDEAKNEIVRKKYYNLGMAVATEAGLIVPVVRDVDTRTILELASDINRLAEAAKAGKVTPDDLKGGTFSITNIGSLGGLFSFPIINAPEAAILGVHSIKKRPVVLADDSIVARQMLYLSLAFDHRLVDGAEGANFTGRVIDLLENPEALMLDL